MTLLSRYLPKSKLLVIKLPFYSTFYKNIQMTLEITLPFTHMTKLRKPTSELSIPHFALKYFLTCISSTALSSIILIASLIQYFYLSSVANWHFPRNFSNSSSINSYTENTFGLEYWPSFTRSSFQTTFCLRWAHDHIIRNSSQYVDFDGYLFITIIDIIFPYKRKLIFS